MDENKVREIIRDELSYFLGHNEVHIKDRLRFWDGKNIQLGRGTGTKIGTAADQKLSFFGRTPVVQRPKASYNNWTALDDVVDALVDLGLFDED